MRIMAFQVCFMQCVSTLDFKSPVIVDGMGLGVQGGVVKVSLDSQMDREGGIFPVFTTGWSPVIGCIGWRFFLTEYPWIQSSSYDICNRCATQFAPLPGAVNS